MGLYLIMSRGTEVPQLILRPVVGLILLYSCYSRLGGEGAPPPFPGVLISARRGGCPSPEPLMCLCNRWGGVPPPLPSLFAYGGRGGSPPPSAVGLLLVVHSELCVSSVAYMLQGSLPPRSPSTVTYC